MASSSYLETLLGDWKKLLTDWAASGRLTAAAAEALQLKSEPELLQRLVAQWSKGDFSGLPPIVLLPSSSMPGAAGAYAISTGTIYLNQDWLQTSSRDWALAVLTEELGHHLDGLLNVVDTPGDEGEVFSRVLFNMPQVISSKHPDISIIKDSANAPILVELSSAPSLAWTRIIGSSSNEEVNSIFVNADGSVWIAGWTEGALTSGSSLGGRDIFVASYTSSGSRSWIRQFGSNRDDIPRDIFSNYIVGSTAGSFDGQSISSSTISGQTDAFLTYLDSSGNNRATRIVGDQYHQAYYSIARGAPSTTSLLVSGYDNGRVYSSYATSGYPDGFAAFISSSSASRLGSGIQSFGDKSATTYSEWIDSNFFASGGWYRWGNGNYNPFVTINKYSGTYTYSHQATFTRSDASGEAVKAIQSGGETGAFALALTYRPMNDSQSYNGGSLYKINQDGSSQRFYSFSGQPADFKVASDGQIWIAENVEDEYGNLSGSLFRLSASGEETQRSTLFQNAKITSITLDEKGGLYVSGSTFSNLNGQLAKGGDDAFIAKVSIPTSQQLPLIVVSAPNPSSVLEDGTSNLVYTFSRTGSTSNALTVNYTIGGTATIGTDYTIVGQAGTATNRSVTFAPGSSTATVTVDPTADSNLEPDETVSLTLAAGTGYTIDTKTAVTGIILNDDRPKISVNSITVVEGGSINTVAQLTVSLDAVYSQEVSVQYSTKDGTAKAGTDYTATTGTLTIAAGQKSGIISIPIINDNINESNETFTVNLSNPVNATISSGTATVTISDTLTSSTTITLPAGVENLTLTGTAPINGTGNAGNNVLTGNSANNRLDGAGGTDTASFSNATGAVTANLATGTATGAGVGTDTLVNIENLTGSNFADRLTGNAGANVLNGGAGADTMIGGAGNDIYIVDNVGDVVTELANEGTDTVQSSVTYTLSANVENLTLTGTAAINGTGNAGNNVLTGNSANNLLSGLAGNDTYRFVANTQLGTDTITEAATSGGTDSINLSGTNSSIRINLSSTTIQTVNQNLKLKLSAANSIENVVGGSANDVITGNSLNNVLSGGDGNDRIAGLAGNDILDGGLGSDWLTGGIGSDQFRFATGSAFSEAAGTDFISDFESGVDKIALSKKTFGAITNNAGQSLTGYGQVDDDSLVDPSPNYIVYSLGSGGLFYNMNGSQTGDPSKVFEFATLGNMPESVTANDFIVIA